MKQFLDTEDVERLLWQIAGQDNWEAIEEVPYWTFMFDRMPDRMRLAVDLRLQGHDVPDIAKMMGVTQDMAYKHLQGAKKRILTSLAGSNCEDEIQSV